MNSSLAQFRFSWCLICRCKYCCILNFVIFTSRKIHPLVRISTRSIKTWFHNVIDTDWQISIHVVWWHNSSMCEMRWSSMHRCSDICCRWGVRWINHEVRTEHLRKCTKRVVSRGLEISFHIDLPDFKTILKFEIWSFSDFWGGILKLSDLDYVTNFMGGVFWNSWIWTLWQLSLWGVFWSSRIWTLWQISSGGVFWNSRIWTLWQILFWGVFWNSRIWTLWQLSFWGGILKLYFRIRGILPHFGPKFQPLQQAHASQIVSHMGRLIISCRCDWCLSNLQHVYHNSF